MQQIFYNDYFTKYTEKVRQVAFLFQMTLIIGLFLSIGLSTSLHAKESEKEAPAAISIDNPDIPLDHLILKLGPLQADQLFVEADAWLVLLQDAATKVYDKKLEISIKNKSIYAANEKNVSSADLESIKSVKTQLIDELTTLRKARIDKEGKLNNPQRDQ